MEYFDAVYCICMKDRPQKTQRLLSQLMHFYPKLEPIIIQAVDTRKLKNHHIGCALSHRLVISDAKSRDYKKILVLEEDAVLHKNFKNLLKANLAELKVNPWNIFYLGACIWERRPPKPKKVFTKLKEDKHLEIPVGCTCTHGLAYHESIYDFILNSLPDNPNGMKEWCKKHAAIDQWLMYHLQAKGAEKNGFDSKHTLISSPRICSQPFLIGKNKQDKPEDFLKHG